MTKRVIDYSLLVEYLASWGFEIYEEMILSSQITIELLEYILLLTAFGYFRFILCTFSWQLIIRVHWLDELIEMNEQMCFHGFYF